MMMTNNVVVVAPMLDIIIVSNRVVVELEIALRLLPTKRLFLHITPNRSKTSCQARHDESSDATSNSPISPRI